MQDTMTIIRRIGWHKICQGQHPEGSDRKIRKGEAWWQVARGYHTVDLCAGCYRRLVAERGLADAAMPQTESLAAQV